MLQIALMPLRLNMAITAKGLKLLKMKIIILIVTLVLISCGNESTTPSSWVKPESTVLGCGDYQSIAVELGVLYNNVWNKQADESGDGIQCLESRTVEGVVQYGWSWSWPEGKRVIYGYPQIKRGPSPWAPQPNSDSRFPIRISAINTLELEFDTETITDGIHNLAASMWLTKEPISGDSPNASAIAAEVMIWTYSARGHFDPAGKKAAEIIVDGARWEVWVDRNWSDASGVNDNRWTYITFRATENSMSAKLNLMELLKYAVEQQLLSANWYVSNLELGNEIMGGSGITWVKSFSVTVR